MSQYKQTGLKFFFFFFFFFFFLHVNLQVANFYFFSFFIFFYFLTLQYCISFAIYQDESATEDL